MVALTCCTGDGGANTKATISCRRVHLRLKAHIRSARSAAGGEGLRRGPPARARRSNDGCRHVVATGGREWRTTTAASTR